MFTAGLCCVTWEQPESQAPYCEQGIRVYPGIISRGLKRGFTGREGKRLWKETCAGCALLLLVPWQWERVPSWYPSSRRVCPLGIWAVRRRAFLVPRQWEDVPSWYFSSGSCCLQLQMSVNQSGNEKKNELRGELMAELTRNWRDLWWPLSLQPGPNTGTGTMQTFTCNEFEVWLLHWITIMRFWGWSGLLKCQNSKTVSSQSTTGKAVGLTPDFAGLI